MFLIRSAVIAVVAAAALAAPLPSFPAPLLAQEMAAPAGAGRIIGRVVDGAQGAPIAGAQVTLQGTGRTVTSALDGRYTLLNVPAGPVTLSVRMIGYQPKSVSGIVVDAGDVVAQNVSLDASVVQLEELAVTAASERGSVNRALEEQRDAPNIINAVTAEQISKTPDSDAGQAVQRVSGVSVQDGKYVLVRGLGERYTTTSLNGARIPSPEPERKVVPLDLFPSGLLEGITTSKTFTPDQPGDFSGASVNLKTREFPLGRVYTVSTSVGANSAATGADIVRAPRFGTEWLGLPGARRELPAAFDGLSSAAGLSQEQMNGLVASFNSAWAPRAGTGSPNGSFSASVGGEDPIFGRQLIGYLGSLSYSYGQEVRADERRALAAAVPGGFEEFNAYGGTTGRSSVLWGGLLNLSTRLGSSTKLSLNNSYTRSAENEASLLAGANEEFDTPLMLSRLTFTARTVRSSQLVAEHLLGVRHLLDWSVTSSGVTRTEPDRTDLRYVASGTGPDAVPLSWFDGAYGAVKTFSDLDESAWDLASNYRLTFGSDDAPGFLKTGVSLRSVTRDARSQPYELRGNPANAPTAEEKRQAPSQLFSDDNAMAGKFSLFFSQVGGDYEADDRITAGYALVDYPIGSRLRLLGGARVERWDLDIASYDRVNARDSLVSKQATDVLPSLALNVILSGTQNLRLSASQTLSRPEYREITNVQSFDAISGTFLVGNPDLERALIRNFDARWEWYPRAGEVVSVGVFAKSFDRPIERVYSFGAGSGAQLSYINADGATNYGLELEVRKRLDFIGAALEPFTVFANTTLMRSELTPGDLGLTSAERPMVGQANYVMNAGLGYANAAGWSGTALYNVVGRRITEAGFQPFDDVYEQPRHLVDLSLQAPVTGALSLRADARNLLDDPVVLMQGDVTRLRYRTGRTFSLGARWTF